METKKGKRLLRGRMVCTCTALLKNPFSLRTGAGNETGTRALNPCFPITFFAAVSSEGLNYSLVLRPRQQNSSNNFHQRPRTAISSPDNRRRIHGYQRPAPATPLDTQVSLRQEWHQHRTLRPRLV
jgi:hypothetical protein